MAKRIRHTRSKPRSADEQFTSVGVYKKTRKILRKGAAKKKVPIYVHVHELAVESENNRKEA